MSLLASLALGSDELTTQVRDQMRAQTDHQKFTASADNPEEAGRCYGDFEAIYTQFGR